MLTKELENELIENGVEKVIVSGLSDMTFLSLHQALKTINGAIREMIGKGEDNMALFLQDSLDEFIVACN